MKTAVGDFANKAVHALNGARALGPAEAANSLRDLMAGVELTGGGNAGSERALDAYRTLIQNLETKGAGNNDDWQQAIETMTALAGEKG